MLTRLFPCAKRASQVGAFLCPLPIEDWRRIRTPVQAYAEVGLPIALRPALKLPGLRA